MSIHRKIQSILSSAETACLHLIKKELTGKKVKLTEAWGGMVESYSGTVIEIDAVKIDGPRHLVVYMLLDRDGEIIYVRPHLNCVSLLSDTRQGLSLNVP